MLVYDTLNMHSDDEISKGGFEKKIFGGGGNVKKVDDPFLVVALKTRAELLNEPFRPALRPSKKQKNTPYV